jgi:membrane protein YqaA with SNARE-associated domain
MLDALQSFFTAEASLWSLLVGSFVAATLVPVSSELMLFAVLRAHQDLLWPALGVATLGNTAGGMVSFAMGRLIPHRQAVAHEALLRRHGAWLLLLSWVPLAGDALCVGAGWLRLSWWRCMLAMVIGKAARYCVVALL